MRYIYLTGLALLLAFQCPVATLAFDTAAPGQTIHSDPAPNDSAETKRMWNMARKYKAQMRFELARQHFLLALSTCRSDQSVQLIQRELQIVELQIRSLR